MNRTKMKSFLLSLKDSELSQVFNRLLADNPDLVKKAYDIAVAITDDVDEDSIMDEVYYALDALDVDELYARSGRTRHGYVEPHDEAWAMFEEAITPFLDEIVKCHNRNQPNAAKVHCIGIIKGLRKFDEDSISDFKDWVVDAPSDYVSSVVDAWKKGNPSENDISDVMLFAECNSF